jgi:hypothetical protein
MNATMKKRLHPSDEKGVRRLVERLVAGTKPTPSMLRWPNCGIVPGWIVIPAPQRMWLVHSTALDGTKQLATLTDEALIGLLKSTWMPLAQKRLPNR